MFSLKIRFNVETSIRERKQLTFSLKTRLNLDTSGQEKKNLNFI